MEITVLCDAVAAFPEPIATALPGWTGVHQAWTEREAPGNVADDGAWWLHFHTFLVTAGSRATLVDTGIGPAGSLAADWLGTSGRLPDLLAVAGVEPGDIDTVVLTHVHLDHTGWNTDGSLPRFANAAYVVQRTEVEHVRGSATYRRHLQPIADADQLRLVDGETVLGTLTVVPTPGHTPGHQSVVAGATVLAGDALVHPAQAHWPELTYVYESDPQAAVASRQTLLRLAEQQGIPLAAAHPHLPLRSNRGDAQAGARRAAPPCGIHRL